MTLLASQLYSHLDIVTPMASRRVGRVDQRAVEHQLWVRCGGPGRIGPVDVDGVDGDEDVPARSMPTATPPSGRLAGVPLNTMRASSAPFRSGRRGSSKLPPRRSTVSPGWTFWLASGVAGRGPSGSVPGAVRRPPPTRLTQWSAGRGGEEKLARRRLVDHDPAAGREPRAGAAPAGEGQPGRGGGEGCRSAGSSRRPAAAPSSHGAQPVPKVK